MDSKRALNETVALLTGGSDKPYALGLMTALVEQGLSVDFIGSDELQCDEVLRNPKVRFLNLRGDQSENVSFQRKLFRLGGYYLRLLWYAASSRAPLFHILWNNRFESVDRTLLMLYYRALGKRVFLTAHNVNMARRDLRDSAWNRLTLRIQYHLTHQVFVHTEEMRAELMTDFRVPAARVSVIPFGINNTIPTTDLGYPEAKRSFGLDASHKILLFFGQVAPYKGLEYLIAALDELAPAHPDYRLVIGGKIKRGAEGYWEQIQQHITRGPLRDQVLQRIGFIPDAEVEVFFKAADVVVLPYLHIFQSGVPFLAYSFGLPVVATDVGSLREDIEEGRTGHVCPPRDAAALAKCLQEYFTSDLYLDLPSRRGGIQQFANERHSWTKVGAITSEVYRRALGK